jgi:hypothetical protein
MAQAALRINAGRRQVYSREKTDALEAELRPLV